MNDKNINFTPDMLKPGYVCKLRNGNFVGVYTGNLGLFEKVEVLCVSGENDWCPVASYKKDMTYSDGKCGKCEDMDIVEVYGFAPPRFASKLSSEERKPLWKREEGVKYSEPKNRYEGMSVKEATEQFKKDLMETGMNEEEAENLAELGKNLAGLMALTELFN